MKKLSIRVEFDNKVVESIIEEFTEDKIKKVSEIIEDTLSGKSGYFSITTSEGQTYMPVPILLKSIITIVNHD